MFLGTMNDLSSDHLIDDYDRIGIHFRFLNVSRPLTIYVKKERKVSNSPLDNGLLHCAVTGALSTSIM